MLVEYLCQLHTTQADKKIIQMCNKEHWPFLRVTPIHIYLFILESPLVLNSRHYMLNVYFKLT